MAFWTLLLTLTVLFFRGADRGRVTKKGKGKIIY